MKIDYRRRGKMSAEERRLRSHLMQLVHAGGLLRANWIRMARRCGNSGCRCTRGKLHVSWYVAQMVKGRRRMLYVASPLEADAREWIARHQKVRRLLEQVSQRYWQRLKERKGE